MISSIDNYLLEYASIIPSHLLFRGRLMQNQLKQLQGGLYYGPTTGGGKAMKHGGYGIWFIKTKDDNQHNANPSNNLTACLQVYEGSFQSDLYHGLGILYIVSPTGSIKRIMGSWERGLLHGEVIIDVLHPKKNNKYDNGNNNKHSNTNYPINSNNTSNYNPPTNKYCIQFKGKYRQNYKQGNGIQYHPNHYFEGNFTRGHRHGKGRVVMANGAYYDGQWVNNMISNRGIVRRANLQGWIVQMGKRIGENKDEDLSVSEVSNCFTRDDEIKVCRMLKLLQAI